MWWFVMITAIMILALFGEFEIHNFWNKFQFEVRLNFPFLKRKILILKVWKTKNNPNMRKS